MNTRLMTASLAPVLLSGAAAADFQGITREDKDASPFDLAVNNVSARFDDPSDRLIGVEYARIRLFCLPGDECKSLFQHEFGGDTAPPGFMTVIFPDLEYDTFVTIGVKTTDEAPNEVDGTQLGADFIMSEEEVSGSWYNGDPDSGQGDAGNYKSGYVLLGQFAREGTQFGTIGECILKVLWQGPSTGGAVVAERRRFYLFVLSPSDWFPADLNHDWCVNAADLAILLGAWGPCPETCWEDMNLDGAVDAADLAFLLGWWGQPCF